MWIFLIYRLFTESEVPTGKSHTEDCQYIKGDREVWDLSVMTERTRLISYLLCDLFSAGDAIETARHSFDNETILVFVSSRSKVNLTTSISQNTLTCGYKWLTLKKFKSWGKDGPSLWLNFVQVSRTCMQSA